MTRHYKLSLALLLSAITSATAATTAQPRVVFIGDWVTYNWTSAFAANPNWINQGSDVPATNLATAGASWGVATRFQADVVNLHPAIVHIMVGFGDQEADVGDQEQMLVPQAFLTNLQTMVQEARAANIQVVLALEPSGLSLENEITAAYGAANNIPVVSYEQVSLGPNDIPTAAGYAQMTQIAENALATLNLTLGGGYLQNLQFQNGSGPAETNVNTVVPGLGIQFTAVGWYNDGSVHPMLNSNLQGATGTWTSSNPLVMYIDQTGLAKVLTTGTTIIRYTSLNGVAFSEWIMYVIPGS